MAQEKQLLIQLQKCIKSILAATKIVLENLSNSSNVLSSIANLCEQLQCCRRVDFNNSPLGKHEGIKSRLEYKISAEIEGKILLLQETIKIFETASSKISSLQNNLMELYQKLSGELSVISLSQGTALYPAPVLMMEWASDLDRDAAFILSEKRYFLETLDFTSDESISRLKNGWQNDHGLQEKYAVISGYVGYFLEDEIT